MTTEQFTELMAELRSIRSALSLNRPSASSPASAQPQPTSTLADGAKPIPLPDSPVPNAEEVEVHFGKNKGVPLGKLQIRSIEWYAQDQEPKLKNDGTPFAPRAEDVALRQAARTIVAQRRGLLPASPAKPLALESKAETITEEVPF